jgi:thermostable 8-oxoguanine DNA glycosylase
VQRIIGGVDGRYEFLELPDPDERLLDDVRWGSFEHPLTPAFWVSQAWMTGTSCPTNFRLGKSLAEEATFCLLGGHGTHAEVGFAAATRVCRALGETPQGFLSRECIELLLREPVMIRGRPIRYRFAGQRAIYLAGALKLLAEIDEARFEDIALRDRLCQLPGIGPKTASWIVRNRRGSDNVAILDVHIVRACQIMNVFPGTSDPARRYFELERRFLDFCAAGSSRASTMDAVMWATMRKLSRTLLQQLVDLPRGFEEPLPMFHKGGA